MINAGVIGCGYWGAKHARVCNELSECRLHSVSDLDLEKARSIAGAWPGAQVASSVDALLSEPALDAVIVATSASTHYDLACRVLAAGKHVLVEKPLSLFPWQARDLIDRARSAAKTLMVGHTFEYNPAVEALKEVVDSGELGKLYYLDFARLNLGLYQRDVNVMYDLSPHDISVMNFILGERPTHVHARGYSMLHEEVIDVAYIEYRFASGVVANSRVSWLAPQKVRETTIVGSMKMALYDDSSDTPPIQIFEKNIAPPVETERYEDWRFAYHYGPVRSLEIPNAEPLKRQMEHFLHCIVTGEGPRTSGENGLSVVCALDAAQRSAAAGGTVERVEYGESAAAQTEGVWK
jgi:predicted dehydrogenase